jgi:hypothetical protein
MFFAEAALSRSYYFISTVIDISITNFHVAREGDFHVISLGIGFG